jgi:apolipoprotein N-acyltransferase
VAVATIRPSVRAPRRAFALGVLAGFVYFLGTVYWVTLVMAGFGGLDLPVAASLAALLAIYLALYTGLFALVLWRVMARFGTVAVWLAPAVWIATEWLRASVGGGFPWVLLGTSQATVIPVVQVASVAGVYGLSGLVALVSTAAAAITVSRKPLVRRPAIAVALLMVVVVAGGTLRVADGRLTRTGELLRVGLVQGNVEQEIKWNPAFRDPILRRYVDLSRQVLSAGAGLVIWPEASTPFFFDSESELAAPIRRLAIETRTPFIIGSDEYVRDANEQDGRIYNSAVLIGPDGRSVASYRKMVLVPFGEYVPLQRLLFFVSPLVEKVSDFSAGTEAVVFDAAGRRTSVAICYESVYPWISAAFVARGSQLLATITNDAWFEFSSAAYQHFEQGAVRAVEQGRYVVRAANTGFSGAVDPYGRVLARTRLFETTTATVDVRLHNGRTIYGRFGDVSVWISLVLTVGMLIAARSRVAVTLNPEP